LLELEPTCLLDVGCGSGVLGVAAAKLGFDPVIALDHDPAAVEAARRNAEANGVVLDIRARDAFSAELPVANVTVANVTGDLVRSLAASLRSDALIGSGYLEFDAPMLRGFARVERRTAQGWAADLFRREE
jgi:ribosomal protein L11 methyltransferase